jgi:hypothetical protein
LASVIASGSTPSAWQANQCPVRPTPVCTSSSTSSAPCRVAISRAARKYPAGGTITPFSPWIGSSSTIAVELSTVDASAATSPYGTWATSPGSGRNGSAFAGWPVSASAPIVRPWNPPSAATTPVRPVRRDSLNAASLASAPELAKKTRPGRPASDSNRSASVTAAGCAYRLETCPSVAICSDTAATMAGCACPNALTAMPPMRST